MQSNILSRPRGILAGAAALAALAIPALADINGFGDGTGFTINNNAEGAASISGGTLNLTTGAGSQASSVFNNTPQNVQNFTSSFTYTDVGGGGADGFAFVLQNDPRGPSARGDGGGALAYAGTDTTRITPSAAVDFNIYGPGGGSRVGFTSGGNIRYTYPNTGTVDIANGQPVNVTINYAPLPGTTSGVISATLTQGANTFTTRPQAFNAPALAGGNTALVGFTGGTGGVASTQTIGNFTYSTGTATLPSAYNVLQASDTITAINGTQFPNGNNGTFMPANEVVDRVVDKAIGTKYLNFGGAGSGLTVTPSLGPTVVTGLVLTSANDSPNRDPASYELQGSNDGTNFVTISAGAIPAFTGRFVEQAFNFPNANAYTNYRVVFPTVADPATNNSMQIGEIQLVGAVPEPGTMFLLAMGALPLLSRRRR